MLSCSRHARRLHPPPRRARHPPAAGGRREPPAPPAALDLTARGGARGAGRGAGAVEPGDLAAGAPGLRSGRPGGGAAGAGGLPPAGPPPSRSVAPDHRSPGDRSGRGRSRALGRAPPLPRPRHHAALLAAERTETNLAAFSWSHAFDALCAKLAAEYPFTRWKGIDWAALNRRFAPRIRDAEARKDDRAYYRALRAFAWSVPDGHVDLRGDDRGLARGGGGGRVRSRAGRARRRAGAGGPGRSRRTGGAGRPSGGSRAAGVERRSGPAGAGEGERRLERGASRHRRGAGARAPPLPHPRPDRRARGGRLPQPRRRRGLHGGDGGGARRSTPGRPAPAGTSSWAIRSPPGGWRTASATSRSSSSFPPSAT